MKMKVSLRDFTVAVFPAGTNWKEVDGIANDPNRIQHPHLSGFVLVETRIVDGAGLEFLLYHPDTKDNTGHIDLYYLPGRYWNNKSPLRQYSGSEEVWLQDFEEANSPVKHLWPTGMESLIKTIDAVEKAYAGIEDGFKPSLWSWLSWRDQGRQTLPLSQHLIESLPGGMVCSMRSKVEQES